MISVFMTELHTLKIGLLNINAKKLSTILVPTVIKFSVREWQRYKTLNNDDFLATKAIA